MTSRFEKSLSLVLTICAVVSTAVLIDRNLGQTSPTSSKSSPPSRVANWESTLTRGNWVGSPSAPLKLLVFVDFQCPFCQQFHAEAVSAIAGSKGRIAVFYRHYPLPMHRHASAAALAADCANEQSRFSDMALALFAAQDSFGMKPWTRIAGDAGVPDLAAFERCMVSKPPAERYALDIAMADSLGIRGTPTVIANGWRLGRPPRADSLLKLAERAASGRSLF